VGQFPIIPAGSYGVFFRMIKIRRSGFVRAFVAVALVSTFVWFFWIQKEMTGSSQTIADGRTHVAASSNPTAVLLSVLGLFFFSLLMNVEVRVGEWRAASLQLRLAALLFDLWFLLLCISGIGSILSLLLEANRTGKFQWHFERDYSVASDGVDFALVLVFLALVVLYFVWPLSRRRQTVGCWIFRLATVSANGDVLNLPFSTAAWRVFMEFRGIIHLVRTVKERDAQGRTWYDRETGLMVVRY
jgi:uncharacterized RDD family membrane protein YckC